MNLDQTKHILAMFSAVYRRAFEGMTDGDVGLMASIWQKKLAPFTYEEVLEATDQLISSSKFMPSLAEVLDVLAKNRCPQTGVPAEQAWVRVRNAVRDYGLTGRAEAREKLTQIENEMVKEIGWTRLCSADMVEMRDLEKSFIPAYKLKSQEALAEVKAGSTVWASTLPESNQKLIDEGGKE